MNVLPDRIKQPIAHTLKSLSTTSKIIFTILACIMSVSVFIITYQLNTHFLVEVPASGSVLKVGIIGTPRLINPVLTENDTGKDIGALVYAGLMHKTASGIEKELAETYIVSADTLTYTFMLKPNLTFHDGAALTSRDVLFTIKTVQNAQIRSPKRIKFDQIKMEVIDDRTITFTLPRQNPNFLADMTIGIIPQHIWSSVKAAEFSIIEYNSEPIGAGPYRISNVTRGKGGLPLVYNLVPFKEYTQGIGLLRRVEFHVYQNEEEAVGAIINNTIDSVGGISAEQAASLVAKGYRVDKHPLPRVFGLFFNQSQNTILADATIRKVLNATAPRDQIVADVFKGFAIAIDSPFDPINSPLPVPMTVEDASAALDKAGWKIGSDGIRSKSTSKDPRDVKKLEFSIATSDANDLKASAVLLKKTWGQLGFNITVNIFESGELNQTIIRERKFDSLLFGEVITQEADYNAFWNSSQRKDPGLNIAQYLNIKVDGFLSDLKYSTSTDNRDILAKLDGEFSKDLPAVMLYSPVYTHVLPWNLSGYYKGPLKEISDRFIGINTWYEHTEKVWPIFTKNRKIINSN